MDAEVETLKKGRQSFRGAIMSQLGKSPLHFSNEFSMQEVKLLFPIVPVAAKPPLGIPAPIDNDRKCYVNVFFANNRNIHLLGCLKVVTTFVLCLIGAVACADIASTPSRLKSTSRTEVQYVLASSVDVRPIGGDSRTLNENSIWTNVGSITEGIVYRLQKGTLTAEAWDVHEAYIVVRDGNCVGLWLPFEKAFVPLSAATPIQLNPRRL